LNAQPPNTYLPKTLWPSQTTKTNTLRPFLYCTPSDVHYLFTVGQDDSEAWYLVHGAEEEDPLLFVKIRELLRTQQG
jgi:hypothetical protein